MKADVTLPRRVTGSGVVVVSPGDDIEQFEESWRQLAENSLEQNVFYEPFNLLPALSRLLNNRKWKLVLVFDGATPGKMIGLFPFTVHGHYCGAPIRHMELLTHKHCYLCTPLIHRDFTSRCLSVFSDWVAAQPLLTIVSFHLVSSRSADLLQRALAFRGLAVRRTHRYVRAFLERHRQPAGPGSAVLSKKSRKEIRRQKRRLSELGRLEFRRLGVEDDVDQWINDFLTLEKSGWKGRNRSALDCRDDNRSYFRMLATGARCLEKLDFCGLYLDDKPVALSCKFRSGHGRFAFKIAYDEAYARYSPGLLLELDYLEATSEEAGFDWLDSCADPSHPLADRIWPDRRGLEAFTVATGPYGKMLQCLRATLKSAFDFRHFGRSRQLE